MEKIFDIGESGYPKMGTHIWPGYNSAPTFVVEDSVAKNLMTVYVSSTKRLNTKVSRLCAGLSMMRAGNNTGNEYGDKSSPLGYFKIKKVCLNVILRLSCAYFIPRGKRSMRSRDSFMFDSCGLKATYYSMVEIFS